MTALRNNASATATVKTEDVVRQTLRVEPASLAVLGRALTTKSGDAVLVGLECLLRITLAAVGHIHDKVDKLERPVVVNAVIGATPTGWLDPRLAGIAQMIVWAATSADYRVIFSFRPERQATRGSNSIDLIRLLSTRGARRLPTGRNAVQNVTPPDLYGVYDELDWIRAQRREYEAELGIIPRQPTNVLIKDLLGLDPLALVRPIGTKALRAFDTDPDGWGLMGFTQWIIDACAWINDNTRSSTYRLFNEQDAEDGLWANAHAANLAMLLAATSLHGVRKPVSFLSAFEANGHEHVLASAARKFWQDPSEKAAWRLMAKCNEHVHHNCYGEIGAFARVLRLTAHELPAHKAGAVPGWLNGFLKDHDTSAWH